MTILKIFWLWISWLLVVGAIALALIAIGYLWGCIISVHDDAKSTTSGVCTSTLCQ